MGERRDGRKGEGTIASPTVRPKYMLEHLMIFFFYIHDMKIYLIIRLNI